MLHEAQATIEKQWSDQEAKNNIVQEEVEQTVTNEDGDIEWEDIEHEADEEVTPSTLS